MIAPVIPSAPRGERRRSVDLHEVLNGILFVLEMGCQWRHLPTDLPPRSTCHDYLTLWGWDGTLQRIHHALYVLAREQEGREASPTAAIVDSQSVRAAQKGGPTRTRVGYDAGKKIKGAKYHIAAGEDADAETMMLYLSASNFFKVSAIFTILDSFCPIAT